MVMSVYVTGNRANTVKAFFFFMSFANSDDQVCPAIQLSQDIRS